MLERMISSFLPRLTGFCLPSAFVFKACHHVLTYTFAERWLSLLFLYQCCGCNIFHKLVDNLNLFHEMKCYVGPDFCYEGDAPFNYLDGGGSSEDGGDNIFPVL